jgi:hypothetical protein
MGTSMGAWMGLVFVLIAYAAVGLFEALLVMLVSKRVKGPKVPWRTAVYWSCVVVLVSSFVSSISHSPRLSDVGSWLASIAGWVALHVFLGGFFLTDQVRRGDGERQPWRWGAKVTAIAGGALAVGVSITVFVVALVTGATSSAP